MALAMVLCGCGEKSQKTERAVGTVAPPAPKVLAPEIGATRKLSEKPLSETQIAEYHGTLESAMDAIPPALRADFQKAFECQAGKNAKLSPAQQIEMDGSWVVKKTEQLKVDRATALAC